SALGPDEEQVRFARDGRRPAPQQCLTAAVERALVETRRDGRHGSSLLHGGTLRAAGGITPIPVFAPAMGVTYRGCVSGAATSLTAARHPRCRVRREGPQDEPVPDADRV